MSRAEKIAFVAAAQQRLDHPPHPDQIENIPQIQTVEGRNTVVLRRDDGTGRVEETRHAVSIARATGRQAIGEFAARSLLEGWLSGKRSPEATISGLVSRSMQHPDARREPHRPQGKRRSNPVITTRRSDLHDEIAAAIDARLNAFEKRLIGWMVLVVVVTAVVTAGLLWLPQLGYSWP